MTKSTSAISSFLNSPRFFNGFWTKIPFPDTEETNAMIIMSPTSILDTKNNISFLNSFGYETNRAIGLALIDSIILDEKGTGDELGIFPKPINRTALFESKLKVQDPATTMSPITPNEESPKAPADFGIKTNNSQISSSPVKDCCFTRQLSLKDMELSEDYTRVITHGPNPKTTYIFYDTIVEGCLGNNDGDDDDDDDDDSKNNYEEDKKMIEYGFEDTNVSTSLLLSLSHLQGSFRTRQRHLHLQGRDCLLQP